MVDNFHKKKLFVRTRLDISKYGGFVWGGLHHKLTNMYFFIISEGVFGFEAVIEKWFNLTEFV